MRPLCLAPAPAVKLQPSRSVPDLRRPAVVGRLDELGVAGSVPTFERRIGVFHGHGIRAAGMPPVLSYKYPYFRDRELRQRAALSPSKE